MWSTGYPFIPVFVHQVGNDDPRCFRQIRILIRGTWFSFHLCNEKQLLAVGRERITFDITIILRQLLASAAIRIHFPQLTAATFIRKERQFSTAFYPVYFVLLPRSTGDLLVACSICVHYKDFTVTLVLRHTVVSYRVSNLLFIGRYGYAADTAHGPESFGSHALAFNLDVRPLDERCSGLPCVFCPAAGSQCHSC